jgi:hypothetical protein
MNVLDVLDAATQQMLASVILEASRAASEARTAAEKAEEAARRAQDLMAKLGPAMPALVPTMPALVPTKKPDEDVRALGSGGGGGGGGFGVVPMMEEEDPAEVRRRDVEALSNAIKLNRVDAIKRASLEVLLAPDKDGFPPLHRIAGRNPRRPYSEMFEAWHASLARNGMSEDRITELINARRIDTFGVDHYALLEACRIREIPVDAVQWLVDHGADVNVRDSIGDTPLVALCSAMHQRTDADSIPVLRALQSSGVLRMDATLQGKTLSEIAKASGKPLLASQLGPL